MYPKTTRYELVIFWLATDHLLNSLPHNFGINEKGEKWVSFKFDTLEEIDNKKRETTAYVKRRHDVDLRFEVYRITSQAVWGV